MSGIRWFAIDWVKNGYQAAIYETADLGNKEFLDFPEFGPLDPNVEFGDPNRTIESPDIDRLFELLEIEFPGCTNKLVNQFISQYEYLDYIQGGRK
ncbi:hypothetical protein [Arenicella xantha]|uniref:Uncharacterized protein n=1 Tax=Arenicella xantha TaxID=644221 RepID=A0A395JE97_9GAMM|nr:hypothetical protein [Arenicella xantha]RBP46604.1 hypothetical protein DFR28_1172 [Arenicella xantha]